jgi:hypothetical protein
VLIGVIIFSTLFYFSPSYITNTVAYAKTMYMINNINWEDYTKLDLSTYQRIQEALLIKEKFLKEGSWYNWLVGFGSGATYAAEGFDSDYQEMLEVKYGGQAHNVHINLVFIFFQWGLAGILLFLWLLLLMWRSFRILYSLQINANNSDVFFVAATSFLFLFSFIFYGMATPPKEALLHNGMLLGIHINAIKQLSPYSVPI